MFEYLDLDAPAASHCSVGPSAGGGPLPMPPNPGTPIPVAQSPHPERVRHLLYGSLAALDRTIKILHALGYAEPNDWSDPLPVPQGGVAPLAISAVEEVPPSGVEVWMVILTKTLFLE
jgi:hypothetical protein